LEVFERTLKEVTDGGIERFVNFIIMKNNDYLKDGDIEQALIDYCSNFGLDCLDLFCLTRYSSDADKKIVGLIRDIRINLILSYVDYYKAGNSRITMIEQKENAQLSYRAAIAYQHNVSNFIFRFRALGDKIMRLILFMIGSSKEIKRFDSAKRKIRTFLTICEENKDLQKYKEIAKIFELLNEQYRTDEAHGMGGKLRNSIFTNEEIGVDDPIIQIGNYWNILVVNRIGSPTFKEIYEMSLGSLSKTNSH
jgi:hypothetical protein